MGFLEHLYLFNTFSIFGRVVDSVGLAMGRSFGL